MSVREAQQGLATHEWPQEVMLAAFEEAAKQQYGSLIG
jgi:hypothetical protein